MLFLIKSIFIFVLGSTQLISTLNIVSNQSLNKITRFNYDNQNIKKASFGRSVLYSIHSKLVERSLIIKHFVER